MADWKCGLVRTGTCMTALVAATVAGCAAETGEDLGSAATGTLEHLAPIADTYVVSAYPADNDNFGSATSMYIGAAQRALVRFSQSDIITASGGQPVFRATLRLQGVGSMEQWSLAAHRMTTDWVEVGSNSGATWNCPNDTVLTDGVPTCPGSEWQIDGPEYPFVSEPTGVTECNFIGNGVCEIDVSADVNAMIAGEAGNFGWLIQMPGPASPTFEAYSRESGAVTQPELVLDVVPPSYIPGPPCPPALDDTKITRVWDVTEHIHTGSCAVQAGIDTSTLDPDRISQLRGRVLDASGNGIAGVTVRVADRPELGWTRTRDTSAIEAAGWWDIAVNGGGRMTIEFSKAGYLPVQRTVTVPWNDYVVTDDVVMLTQQPAAQCTALSATSGGVHVIQTPDDGRGARSMALYIPSSSATEVLDSTGAAVSDYCVCAVEYTVDRSAGSETLEGELAMPAELPPTSHYTFAADLQLRQQDGSGACTDIPITSPVFREPGATCSVDTDCAADGSRSCVDGRCESAAFTYVEDFLGFAVGTVVPSGYYEYGSAAWMAERDGRVVAVVDAGGGNCGFDITGDGVADTDIDGLSAHVVTAAEQAAFSAECGVGEAFQIGDVVWRVPMTHLSSHDWNWAVDFFENALLPFLAWAGSGPTNAGCDLGGSIIGCEDQALSEQIPVTGTPWALHYQSSRQRGRRDRYSITIPFEGTAIDGSPSGDPPMEVHIRAQVAGRRIADERVPYTNGSYQVSWDGTDAWGRLLQGAQPIRISMGYVYEATYSDTSSATGRSFGLPPGSSVAVTAREIVFWSTRRSHIGGWDEGAALDGSVRGRGLGGWSLTPHHVYDATAGVLHRGDGSHLNTRGLQPQIDTSFHGPSGAGCINGGTGSGHSCTPAALSVAPDGTRYFVESGFNLVYRVLTEGTVEVFAGTGSTGAADGHRLAATLSGPSDLAVTRTGDLIILEGTSGRVRRIRDDVVTTLATGFPGAQGVAVGPDDTVYVSDTDNDQILAVMPDGRVLVFAASGSQLDAPRAIAVNDRGEVIVETFTISGRRLKRILPVGDTLADRISLIAGGGGGCSSNPDGDGGPAVDGCLDSVRGIGIGPDGSVYLAEWGQERIRRISPTGIIDTVAGAGGTIDSGVTPARHRGDGGAATAAHFMAPVDVAVAPDGRLYIADDIDNRIRVVEPALPDSVVGEVVVAEPDASL